jgi:hypothetical protein
VGAFKSVDYATGRKFYTPAVMAQPLRMAFHKKSVAVEYAQRIYDRYQRLLTAEREMKKNDDNKSK